MSKDLADETLRVYFLDTPISILRNVQFKDFIQSYEIPNWYPRFKKKRYIIIISLKTLMTSIDCLVPKLAMHCTYVSTCF